MGFRSGLFGSHREGGMKNNYEKRRDFFKHKYIGFLDFVK